MLHHPLIASVVCQATYLPGPRDTLPHLQLPPRNPEQYKNRWLDPMTDHHRPLSRYTDVRVCVRPAQDGGLIGRSVGLMPDSKVGEPTPRVLLLGPRTDICGARKRTTVWWFGDLQQRCDRNGVRGDTIFRYAQPRSEYILVIVSHFTVVPLHARFPRLTYWQFLGV